jgi:hypothetical protein
MIDEEVENAAYYRWLAEHPENVTGNERLTPEELAPRVEDYRYKARMAEMHANALAERWTGSLELASGPNVRAIDVPQNLRLLDVEAPLAPADKQAISGVLRRSPDPRDVAVADQFDQWTSSPSATGKDAFDALSNVNSRFANETLARAGFDGISYSGGRRIPMADAAGQPIQHTAVVIFPESLDKLRNAISGTQGGQARADFALGLGGLGAAGAGALAARDQVGDFFSNLGTQAQNLTSGFRAPSLEDVTTAVGERLPTFAPTLPPESPVARAARGETLSPGEVVGGVTGQVTEGLAEAYLPDAPKPVQQALAAALNPANLAFGAVRAPLAAGGAVLGSQAAREIVRNLGGDEMAQEVASLIGSFAGGMTPGMFEQAAPAIIQAAKNPALIAALRTRQAAESEAGFAAGGLGKLLPEHQPPGPTEILGPRGEVLSRVEPPGAAAPPPPPPPAPPPSPPGPAAPPPPSGPKTLKAAVAAAAEPSVSGLQQANTVRLAGMLSNTNSILQNVSGNAINAASEVPRQLIASGIDMARVALFGGQRQRYVAETLPMIQATGPGIIAKLPDMLKVLRSGVTSEEATRLENVGQGLQSYYTKVLGIPVGRALTRGGGEVVDAAIEAPLRVMHATDVLMRGGFANGFANGLATRQGLQEGLKGQALDDRVNYIMQHLTEFPELTTEADRLARRVVLQETRTIPWIGDKVAKIEDNPAMRFLESQVVPFTRTPWNSFVQSLADSPLGVLGAAQSIRQGRVGEAEDQAARALMGSALFTVGLWMGNNGMLTAAYPDDPALRSTLPNGWREWSVRLPVGDGAVYIPMQSLGPWGLNLAAAAIATDPVHKGKPWATPEQVPKLAAGLGKYTTDMTFLQGVSDTLEMLNDPEHYAQRWAEQEARSFVPYSGAAREYQQLTNMVNRDPRVGTQGVIDALAATYPMTAGTVPEKTNALGDPVFPTATGPAAALARYTVERDDRTLKVLRENDVGISPITKAVNVPAGSVKLTEAEQADFKKARGDLIKRYVESEVAGGDFQKGSPTARKVYLEDAVRRANANAREQMLDRWSADRAAWQDRIEPKAVPEPYYVGAPP